MMSSTFLSLLKEEKGTEDRSSCAMQQPMNLSMDVPAPVPTGPAAEGPVRIDSNFEPISRARCNTWPMLPEGFMESEEPPHLVPAVGPPPDSHREAPLAPKKNTSRRNPWGNMSYADLIAQAIASSSEGRATLSQIYEWMVQNIPYFKDKGDSNSSAGWKVSS